MNDTKLKDSGNSWWVVGGLGKPPGAKSSWGEARGKPRQWVDPRGRCYFCNNANAPLDQTALGKNTFRWDTGFDWSLNHQPSCVSSDETTLSENTNGQNRNETRRNAHNALHLESNVFYITDCCTVKRSSFFLAKCISKWLGLGPQLLSELVWHFLQSSFEVCQRNKAGVEKQLSSYFCAKDSPAGGFAKDIKFAAA